MSGKAEQIETHSAADTAKLTLAVLVLLAAGAAFYWFSGLSTLARLGIVLGGLVIAAVIANFTWLGRQARVFATETRFEVRKIVWPTRDETIRTTLIVIAVVILLALLLGLYDLILKSLILDWLLRVG